MCRKYTFWFLFFDLVLCKAQKVENPKKDILKVNVFGWFSGQFQLFWEHKINTRSSFQIGLGAINGGRTFSAKQDSTQKLVGECSGFIINAEYRYYFQKDKGAMSGAYLAPFLRLKGTKEIFIDNYPDKYISAANYSFTNSYQFRGFGFSLGKQWIKKRFSFDLFAGLQLSKKTYKNTFVDESQTYDELKKRYTTYSYPESGFSKFRVGFLLGIPIR